MSELNQAIETYLSTLNQTQLMWGLGLLFIVMIWDLYWKGTGMWKAAQNLQPGWFIAILLVNSIGILPIIYLTWFQKEK